MVIRDRLKDNKTMKLFEIPIYAYSPEGLQKKVSEYKEKHKESYEVSHEKIDQQHMNACANFACSPYQTWQYNHIVGYIVIVSEKNDIVFELYLQTHSSNYKSRYIWRSNQKWFLCNQNILGYHFMIKPTDTNDIIKKRVFSFLEGIIKEFIPSKYYVDREAFENINKLINYESLLK